MNIEQIHRVLVVGAGTMGQQIGLQCAMHGYDVVLYDIQAAALETAMENVKGYLDELARAGRLDPQHLPLVLSKIKTSSNPRDAAQDVDLLSESVYEDATLKGKVFAEFDKLCAPHTLFTTNTSTLLPSQYAAQTGRAARFAALHFHSPVWYANVVDIMPHDGTDAEVVLVLQEFARSIGQIPILIKKEHSGYVFNSMLGGIINTSLELAASNVASVHDIDRAWMGVTKMTVGPFGIMDLIGIDLIHHIVKDSTKWVRFLPRVRRLLQFLQPYVDKGWLGRKTNHGFYVYPHPEFETPGFVDQGARE